METYLLAGVLLGLACACIVLPAVVLLAGDDREERR
jgi:hypothetical protein